MVFLYLSVIFVICLSTFSVYSSALKKKDDVDINPILNQLSLNKVNNFENFQNHMKEPIENINKTLHLLESLKQYHDNMELPLIELLTLKTHLETISSSITSLDNKQLFKLITEMQQDLQDLKINQDFSKLDKNIESVKLVLSNIKLPVQEMVELKSMITAVEKSLKGVIIDPKQLQQIITKIEDINLCEDIARIESNLQTLPEILQHSKDVKQYINTLTTIVNPNLKITDVENKLIELDNKYSEEILKIFTNVTSIIESLKMVKDSVESLPVSKILAKVSDSSENINNNLQTVQTNILENKDSLNKIHPTLNNILINSNAIQQIQDDGTELKTMFKKVLDTLKPGARNLLQDGVIYIRNAINDNYSITIKSGLYTSGNLQSTIRDLLKKESNKFKVNINNNLIEVEYSIDFHMDNNLREFLGFPSIGSAVFMKKYSSQDPHNMEHVILETLVHKNSVDAITKRVKSQFNNQISIVNKLPKDLKNINTDLKTITSNIAKMSTPVPIVQAIDHLQNEYDKDGMFSTIDFIMKLYKFDDDFKAYFSLPPDTNLTPQTIFTTLANKISVQRDDFIQKIKAEVLNELLDKKDYVLENSKLATAFQSQLGALEFRLESLVRESNRKLDQVKTLLQPHP